MAAEQCIRFVPTRVEGVANVTEVAVYPDRLELRSEGKWLALPFVDMIELRPRWLRPLLRLLSPRLRTKSRMVGERDWFHPPPERFFRFFTSPPLVIYFPDEPPGTTYGDTVWWRVLETMARGGYHTWDLG